MKLSRRKRNLKTDREMSAYKKQKIYTYASFKNPNDEVSRQTVGREQSGRQNIFHKVLRLINYTVLIIVLAGVGYLTILDDRAVVKTSGSAVLPRAENTYESYINQQLSSSLLNRNKLTFNGDKFAEKIQERFPEIETVKVDLPLIRHRPTLEIIFAKPSARLVTTDKVYILDQRGRALFEEKDASSSLDTSVLLTINDASGHTITLGKSALTELQLDFINELIGQAEAKQSKIETFTLANGGSAVDVRYKSLKYFVKYSFYEDAKQSSGAFIAVLNQLKKDGTVPKEYIDLRIPERAYIK